MTKAEYQNIRKSLRNDLIEARGAFADWRKCQNCADYSTSLYCDEHTSAMQVYADTQNAFGSNVRIFR